MSEALKDIIIQSIQANGPMCVGAYMEQCLSHPEFGYYMGRDPFGRAGDFITAPEISQMFGEMVGAWLVNEWQSQGAPERFTLLECGPGRGTLMADVLRVASKVPAFIDAAQVSLLEVSPVLRAKQKTTLSDYDVHWFGAVSEIQNDLPLFFVGNEFLDALPIDQYVFQNGAWRERTVNVEEGELIWSFGEGAVDIPGDYVLANAPKEGDVLEVSPVQKEVMLDLCERVQRRGGSGLVIDYGYFEPNYGDTLQALKNSRYSDVLAEPGRADLTAHVNFKMLRETAQACGLDYALNTQGEVLKRCGIEYRAQALMKIANDKQRLEIQQALHRLCGSDEMGVLFKVIEISKGNKG